MKEISVRLKGNLFPYHACSLPLVQSNIQGSWGIQGGGISYEKLSRVVKRVVQLLTMITRHKAVCVDSDILLQHRVKPKHPIS